jgi:hypothetical protein
MDKNELDFDIFDYGKRISLDIGVTFQLKLVDVAYPLQSILVGMEIDEYLIIKIPSQFGNVKHKLFPGVEIIVRYIHQGIIFGFQTKLIDVIFKPVKLLFLEYPKIIEHHELRSHKRAHSIFPAKVSIKDKVSNGAIIDISKSGCRCHILATQKEPLPPVQIDDEVLLTCKFPGIHGDHNVLGIVRNIKKSRKDLILGVEFKIIEEKLNDHIINYIYSIEDFASYPPK